MFFNISSQNSIDYIASVFPFNYGVNKFDIGMFSAKNIGRTLYVLFTDKLFGVRMVKLDRISGEISFEEFPLNRSNIPILK